MLPSRKGGAPGTGPALHPASGSHHRGDPSRLGEAQGNYAEFRFFTGLRPSEQITLQVNDCDVGEVKIMVNKARVMRRDKDRIKTGEDRMFVQSDRFRGTCYKAANWIHVGQTTGRGKLDVTHQHALPVKDIWLYPLVRSFRHQLTA